MRKYITIIYMSLPIKKVYVNSRYKTKDSVSDTNFKFELPYVLTMPRNGIFYITHVCIPKIGRAHV